MGLREDALAFYNAQPGDPLEGYISPDDAKAALNKVFDAIDTTLPKAGGTMSGVLNMGSQKITGLATATASTDAVTKAQLDTVSAVASAALPRSGGTMTGAVNMGAQKVTNLGTGTASTDAVTKAQLDAAMPIGTIVAYGGSVAPSGWKICDGTAHGSSALQAVIGSATVPDLRNRFILGSGSRANGATGGAETHTLSWNEMPVHSHSAWTVNAGGHNHGGSTTSTLVQSLVAWGASQDVGSGSKWRMYDPQRGEWHGHGINWDGDHGHGVGIGDSGANWAHNNMPPFYVLTYIIKTV